MKTGFEFAATTMLIALLFIIQSLIPSFVSTIIWNIIIVPYSVGISPHRLSNVTFFQMVQLTAVCMFVTTTAKMWFDIIKK